MEAILGGFADVATPLNLLVVFIGTWLGIAVGALPGLSSPMAITVLLPLTYGMGTLPAMLLMIGVYVGTKLGGAFPAILLRTPGTPAGACTALDGHSMAMRGEAGKALGYAVVGSTAGGVFGWVIAVTFIPALSTIAIKATNADIALIGLLGLVMVSSFVRGSMLKGLIGVVFGLLISTVGLDPLDATERFTFGIPELMEGIPYTAALIGFFGIAVVLADLELLSKAVEKVDTAVKMALPTFRDVIKRWQAVAIGGAYGTAVGAVPGVGAEGATWLAYATVRTKSRDPESFGKGNPDGILAPEATNNAVTGGSMVPMLTLGIPGDASTAIMLGALVLHGLEPGIMLMRNGADIVYGILAGLLVATLFMFVIAWTAIRPFVKVLGQDRSWLFPFVLVLAVIGAFASTNTIYPVWVALGFGVIGLLLEKAGFPIVTVVLGIILGPVVEYNARLALTISNNDWSTFVQAPHQWAILAITVALLLKEVVAAVGTFRDLRAPGSKAVT